MIRRMISAVQVPFHTTPSTLSPWGWTRLLAANREPLRNRLSATQSSLTRQKLRWKQWLTKIKSSLALDTSPLTQVGAGFSKTISRSTPYPSWSSWRFWIPLPCQLSRHWLFACSGHSMTVTKTQSGRTTQRRTFSFSLSGLFVWVLSTHLRSPFSWWWVRKWPA